MFTRANGIVYIKSPYLLGTECSTAGAIEACSTEAIKVYSFLGIDGIEFGLDYVNGKVTVCVPIATGTLETGDDGGPESDSGIEDDGLGAIDPCVRTRNEMREKLC
eukprot:CAMPEP_0203755666 /NCGR_PEP_ID=MMETSP0098-20131031/9074_1 /ASSEMBLY_ACC=CAM_ASM_000208 /TAXON_ID=96639 /ORGANISM=" , Strain NY0313808BC1" /LENGTH=105 /DNA_ID=CAMNT_0050647225 /DNA_START=318 /DNA_END=635 /DNA_ORIENTATION=-